MKPHLPIFLLGALLLAGCGDDPQAPAGTPAGGPESGTATSSQHPKFLGQAPSFTLTDQDGKPFDAKQLKGKVWVATFFFTRCRRTCPIQTSHLEAFQELLADRPERDQIRIVSVSLDGAHDTPEVLRTYADAYDADTTHWSFLTGDEKTIWTLVQKGFRLSAGPDPATSELPAGHSSRFVVVDREGRIRAYVDSQPEGSEQKLLEAVEPIVAEQQ